MGLGFDFSHAALDFHDVSPHDDLVAGTDRMTEAEFIDSRKERNEPAVFFRIQKLRRLPEPWLHRLMRLA